VLIRDNGHTTNPHRLVNSLADAFCRQGGRIERKRATGFEFDGERLTGIRTENGTIAADAAVVAAGIWSKSLASELGDRIPLETERGYHLIIRDPEVSPRIPIADADGKFVATPMETGLRFAGTVELAGLPHHRIGSARVFLSNMPTACSPLSRRAIRGAPSKWVGHRPSTPDSLPVIGRSRRSRMSSMPSARPCRHGGFTDDRKGCRRKSLAIKQRVSTVALSPLRDLPSSTWHSWPQVHQCVRRIGRAVS